MRWWIEGEKKIDNLGLFITIVFCGMLKVLAFVTTFALDMLNSWLSRRTCNYTIYFCDLDMLNSWFSRKTCKYTKYFVIWICWTVDSVERHVNIQCTLWSGFVEQLTQQGDVTVAASQSQGNVGKKLCWFYLLIIQPLLPPLQPSFSQLHAFPHTCKHWHAYTNMHTQTHAHPDNPLPSSPPPPTTHWPTHYTHSF